MLISNRSDAPQEVLRVYTKRWRIEVFFRNAKQELGLNDCHSTTEIHHHAHFELLFAVETLLNYAKWYENKEKTSSEESFTHGKMVSCLFHTRCKIKLKTQRGSQQVHIYMDTAVRSFARLFNTFWPEETNVFREMLFKISNITTKCISHVKVFNTRTSITVLNRLVSKIVQSISKTNMCLFVMLNSK